RLIGSPTVLNHKVSRSTGQGVRREVHRTTTDNQGVNPVAVPVTRTREVTGPTVLERQVSIATGDLVLHEVLVTTTNSKSVLAVSVPVTHQHDVTGAETAR